MKTKLIGLIASVALMGSGAALAGDEKKHDKQTQSQGATGGSGTQGSTGQVGSTGQQGSMQQLGSNEITGRVVKTSKKMVWVEHAGAIVPLKINKQTQFADPTLKRAQDFKEGDEIRANFEVQKTDNIATSIQRASSGMGGSGLDMSKDPDALPPSPPLDDGTGGSGSDLTPRDPSTEGNSSDLGSDASKGEGDY